MKFVSTINGKWHVLDDGDMQPVFGPATNAECWKWLENNDREYIDKFREKDFNGRAKDIRKAFWRKANR